MEPVWGGVTSAVHNARATVEVHGDSGLSAGKCDT